jgi:hypothetical protein
MLHVTGVLLVNGYYVLMKIVPEGQLRLEDPYLE